MLTKRSRLPVRCGFPVAVVKLASRILVHKTEAGGVQLNLRDEGAVRQAYDRIRQRLVQDDNLEAMEGVLVQPMVPAGVEVMVGVTEISCSGQSSLSVSVASMWNPP